MKPIYFNVFAKFIGSSVYPIVRCDHEGFKIGCYSETPALLTQEEIGPAITAAYSLREVTETTVKPDPQAESQREEIEALGNSVFNPHESGNFTVQQQAERQAFLALSRRPVSLSQLAEMTGKSEEYLRALYGVVKGINEDEVTDAYRSSCCGD